MEQPRRKNEPAPLSVQLNSAGDAFSAPPETRYIEFAEQRITEKDIADAIFQRQKKIQTDYHSYSWGKNREAVTHIAPARDFRYHFANSYLDGFLPFSNVPLWMPLYSMSHTLSYRTDQEQYGAIARDIWQTPRETFYLSSGDCEDHAIALADWLIGLGHDARVVLGTAKGSGHAWVVLIAQGESYLLEATHKRMRGGRALPLASMFPDYQAEFMFNRDSFWVNTSGEWESDYLASQWQLRSRYSGRYQTW